MANTAAAMLTEARKWLGTGEPNAIQKWYKDRNGNAYSGNFAWCDASITRWAVDSGNYDVVCHNTDYAYTVYHANRFFNEDEWFPGTEENVRKCKPGDIVFFDWDGSNTRSNVDHVGIVEKNLGDGRVQTIEGNTADECLRRVRDSSTIAGYGRPKYKAAPKPPADPGSEKDLTVPPGSPILKLNSTGNGVKQLQKCLNHAGLNPNPKLAVDGQFGPKTKAALVKFQKKVKIKADGEYGPITSKALRKAVK